MKNKKAFTLIELLSVIVLLGVIALIAIPNIDKLLKDSKEDLYQDQLLLIEKAAKLWGIENKMILEDNETWPYTILLSDLQELEYIDENITNPKTNKPFDHGLQINITKEANGKYHYEVVQ